MWNHQRLPETVSTHSTTNSMALLIPNGELLGCAGQDATCLAGFSTIKPPGSWKFDMSPESLDHIRLHGKLGPGSVDVCRFNIEKWKAKGLWQTLSCFIGKTFTCWICHDKSSRKARKSSATTPSTWTFGKGLASFSSETISNRPPARAQCQRPDCYKVRGLFTQNIPANQEQSSRVSDTSSIVLVDEVATHCISQQP